MKLILLILASILALSCLGCAGNLTEIQTSTPQTLSYQEENPLDYSRLCDELPAHITRSQLGNRPIVVNGIQVVCF